MKKSIFIGATLALAVLLVVPAIRTFASGWTQQTSSGSHDWYGMAASSDNKNIVAIDNGGGSGGYIYTSTDYGVTWTRRTGSGSFNWRAVASSADGKNLAAARGAGYVYTSSDYGVTWTAQTATPVSHVWYGIGSSSDGRKLVVVAGDGGGYVFTSTDYGVSWVDRSAAAGAHTWTDVTSSSDGLNLAAFAPGGQIYASRNSGVSWAATGSPALSWAHIASSSNGNKIIATSNTAVYVGVYSGGAWTWTNRTPSGATSTFAVTVSPDGTKIVVGANGSGNSFLSSDGGTTWTTQPAPSVSFWRSLTTASDGIKIAGVDAGGTKTAWTLITTTTPCVISSFTATPTSIAYGASSSLSWVTTGCTSATVSGPGVSSTLTSGTISTGPLTSSATYTINATNGTTPVSSTVAVTVGTGTPCTSSGIADDKLHGFAWSSTTGWISLNCTEGGVGAGIEYAVGVDPTSGIFSGYAWSSNVGWIGFDPSDVTAQCGPVGILNFATGQVTGWGRVISGDVASGADGCISLSGLASTGAPYGLSYSATSTTPVVVGSSPLPGHVISGYAWGDMNQGWINFNYATLDSTHVGASVDLKINGTDGPLTTPDSDAYSATLSWTTASVVSCTVDTAYTTDSYWTGTKSRTGGSSSIVIPANTTLVTMLYTYGITCTDSLGTDSSDLVTVLVPPSATTTVIVTTGVPTQTLLADGVARPDLPTALHLTAAGGDPRLTWSNTDLIRCTAFTSGSVTTGDWVGSKDDNTVGAIGQTVHVPPNTTSSTIAYVYGIHCYDTSMADYNIYAHIVTDPATTPFIHFAVDGAVSSGPPYTVDYGTPVNITWYENEIRPGTCVPSSAPAYVGWDRDPVNFAPLGGSPYLWGAYYTGPLTADQDFTLSNCIPIGSTTPLPSQTVHVLVNPAASGTTGGTINRRPPWQEF